MLFCLKEIFNSIRSFLRVNSAHNTVLYKTYRKRNYLSRMNILIAHMHICTCIRYMYFDIFIFSLQKTNAISHTIWPLHNLTGMRNIDNMRTYVHKYFSMYFLYMRVCVCAIDFVDLKRFRFNMQNICLFISTYGFDELLKIKEGVLCTSRVWSDC